MPGKNCGVFDIAYSGLNRSVVDFVSSLPSGTQLRPRRRSPPRVVTRPAHSGFPKVGVRLRRCDPWRRPRSKPWTETRRLALCNALCGTGIRDEDWDDAPAGSRPSGYVATPGPPATTPVNAARANGGTRGREGQHLPDRGQAATSPTSRRRAAWTQARLPPVNATRANGGPRGRRMAAPAGSRPSGYVAHVATPGPLATTPVNATRANGGPRGRRPAPAGSRPGG